MIIYKGIDAKVTILTYPKVGSSTIDDIVEHHKSTWEVYKHDQVINPKTVAEMVPADHTVYFLYRDPLDRYITGFTFYILAMSDFFSGFEDQLEFDNTEWFYHFVANIFAVSKYNFNLDYHCNRKLLELVAVQSLLCQTNKEIHVVNLNNLDQLLTDTFGSAYTTRANETSTGWSDQKNWRSSQAPAFRKIFKDVIETELETKNRQEWANYLDKFLSVDQDIYNFFESLPSSTINSNLIEELLKILSDKFKDDYGYFKTGERYCDTSTTGYNNSYTDILYNWALEEKNSNIFKQVYKIAHTDAVNNTLFAFDSLTRLSEHRDE